ncbi:hypothetical protein [Schlesneria sp. T3-172]|uniref:hypothetical protein n=1 Tax=Schlesneria sphaerica TaxID=3373610 RepID=UPI0037CCB9CB
MSIPSLSFATQIADVTTFTNAEFLQAIEWDRNASDAVKEAARRGSVAAFTKAWHANRRVTGAGPRASAGYGEKSMWSRQAYPEESGLVAIISRAAGLPAKRAGNSARRPVNKPAATWQQTVQPVVGELIDAISSEETRPLALLAALELLDQSGHRLQGEQFFTLWRATLTELMNWPAANLSDPTIPPDVLLVENGEIPFVGGLVFRDVANSVNLTKSGRKQLSKELVERTDTDGTPHADIISRLSLWLAPLIRSTLASERFGVTLWSDDQRQLLGNVVDRAIVLCRPDGRGALANGLGLDSLPVVSAAAGLFGLSLVHSTGAYLQAVQRAIAGKPQKRSRSEIATMPSSQSDWARFAVLRSDWSVNADSVAITHHRSLPQLDVTALGRPFIHGDWALKLKIGDADIELADEWSCVCWQSDPDADFIELQMSGPGRLSVERLVMLSRKERFLFIADSVSGIPILNSGSRGRPAGSDIRLPGNRTPAGTRQRIEYESRLPLCEGMVATCAGPTREGKISGSRFKARVFPLGIPQDRVLSTPHEFSVEGNDLVLKHVAEGEGLFAPLLFVWHPERTRVDATWRTLTVTEDGRVVGPDAGVGYRLKLGDFQLMISRNLKKTGYARACLGHHTFNETVVGKFDSNGDIEPILMVE